MSFSIIRAETRAQRMIGWFSGICQGITDFIVGSKIRSKFETLAVEMEAQDFAFYQAAKKAIPIAVYQAFGFTLIPAVKATGIVTFYATSSASDIKIPQGTQVATLLSDPMPEKVYEVITDTYLTAGNTSVQVNVIAVDSGAIGNTPANSITVLKTPIAGINSVNNTSAITSGIDRESEESRRIRFLGFIGNLVRGTISAVEYGAKTAQLLDIDGNVTERVYLAKVIEPYLPDNATGTLSKTGAYTVVAGDDNKLISCVGTFTVSMTAAATLGADFNCWIANDGTGIITIDPSGSELIDGFSTISVTPAEVVGVGCTGTEFWVARAGNITCYVYNGTGGTSDAIVAAAQQIVDGYTANDGTNVPGYKAAGVVCTIAKATEVATDITMAVTAISTASTSDKAAIETNISNTLAAYIQTLALGDTLLLSKIIELAMSVDGVYNVALSAPSADVVITDNEIVTAGTITVVVS